MIYSPFHIKYLYLNILSAASVPRRHSTSNLLSTCHVLAWGSGPSKQTCPWIRARTLCSVVWLWEHLQADLCSMGLQEQFPMWYSHAFQIAWFGEYRS